MVEMIQWIFRSFDHNNLGALYPPEGTGFTARVISLHFDRILRLRFPIIRDAQEVSLSSLMESGESQPTAYFLTNSIVF